jgi:hypothetical protein
MEANFIQMEADYSCMVTETQVLYGNIVLVRAKGTSVS